MVLKAVEEGKLNLNDKLVDLLSGFQYEGGFHQDITLHNLLCHSSGLPDYDGVNEVLKENDFIKLKRLRLSNDEYVNFISKINPVSEPNEQFYYSNFAYHLFGIILEVKYQMPFHQILNEKLTIPLGLENTVSVLNNERIIPQIAKGYKYNEESGEWFQNNFIHLSLGNRVFSTVSDLNRWALVMDNPGYLSKVSLELMKTNHLSEITKKVSYGYGWVVVDRHNKSKMGGLEIDKPYIIHGGSTEGYKAMLININEGEFVISILSNSGNKTDEMQIAKQIVNLIINKK